MLKISSILNHIANNINVEDGRYIVQDDEHILDTKTGVRLHIYDDWFKFTYDGEVVATMRDFDTNVEQPLVWEIKAMITDTKTMEENKQNYLPLIKERRVKLSHHFEEPKPVQSKHVMMEDDVEEYQG